MKARMGLLICAVLLSAAVPLFADVTVTGSIAPELVYSLDLNDDNTTIVFIEAGQEVSVFGEFAGVEFVFSETITERGIDGRVEKAKALLTPIPEFVIVFGKDRVFEGVGYGWNPVDLFNMAQSPLFEINVRSDKDNPLFFSASYFLVGESLSCELGGLLLPSQDPSDWIYNGRCKLTWSMRSSVELFLTCAGGFSTDPIAACYLRALPSFIPWCVAYTESQLLLLDMESWKILVGLQLTPPLPALRDSLQVQLEYYHNNQGEMGVLGSTYNNYVYGGLFYNGFSLSLSLGLMANVDDDLGMLGVCQAEYRMKENTKLYLQGNVPFGDDVSEFVSILNQRFQFTLGCEIHFNLTGENR